MKTRVLITAFAFVAFFSMQSVFASPEPGPEPTPVCKPGTVLKYSTCVSVTGPVCGPGTTLQDGVCVVDQVEEHSTAYSSSAGRWGGPAYAFDPLSGDYFSMTEKQVRYNIPYSISNGMVDSMILDCDAGYLLIQVTPQHEEFGGTITLDLPRSILDPKIKDNDDDPLLVLRNGEEIEHEEIPHAKYREISMSFLADTQEIEIIHTFIPGSKSAMCKIAHDPPYSYLLPPTKQIKSGIAADDIQCKDDLRLVQRTNGKMACMKAETLCGLEERSTEMIDHKFSGKKYPVLLCKDKTAVQNQSASVSMNRVFGMQDKNCEKFTTQIHRLDHLKSKMQLSGLEYLMAYL